MSRDIRKDPNPIRVRISSFSTQESCGLSSRVVQILHHE